MHKKKSRKRTQIISLILLGMVLLSVAFFTFSANFNKVHNLLLEKDIEQITFTSNFVTKLIQTEIEGLLMNLEASQKMFLEYSEYNTESAVNNLKEICEDFQFEKAGIADLEGNSIDSTGKREKLQEEELLTSIRNNENYVSNVIDLSDVMILAVPICRNDSVVGVIWGYYRIEKISEKIDLNKTSHRYFQIIDDTGVYISDSSNVNSFAQDVNVWEEMKRYEIADGITIEEIRENVENGEKGEFYFSYKGKGRYVTYEPLGINNWYVFSVLVEEYLTDYVMQIERIFSYLLWGVLACIALIAGAIGYSTYRTTAYIKAQNDKLSSKNSLLFMVLKHTNDIPFEVDLAKRTLTIYRSKETEKTICKSLDYYTPDNMLKNRLISADEYENYRYIYENIVNRKKIESPVLKVRIDGIWDYNKVHINIMDEDRVIGFLEDYNEQVYQSEKINEINKKNQTDPLTSLYNREYFSRRVNKLLKENQIGEVGESALFILDLDYFKQANDTLGHLIGDQILKESALAMKSIVRSSDLAGRLGGDEFVLFIRNVRNLQAIHICAEKINCALQRTYGEEGKEVAISASIGIAVVTTETTFEELYQMADIALYKVKEKGRNGYHIITKEKESDKYGI